MDNFNENNLQENSEQNSDANLNKTNEKLSVTSKKFDHFTEYHASIGCLTFIILNFIFILFYSLLPLGWCSKLYESKVTGYNGSFINVKYDECNPFGMVAGDFGEITSLSKHSSKSASNSTIKGFDLLGEKFSTFMVNFEIPTDDTHFNPTISSDALEDYTQFYNQAMQLYNNSLVSFTKNINSDLKKSAVIGLNYQYTMFFGIDESLEDIDFQTTTALLFGFESKTAFIKYAQNLINIYEQHRIDIDNSVTTNDALDDGCFYTSNGSFVFPIAVKSELSSTVLTYVILDTNGFISVWINDVNSALQALNYGGKFISGDINNELYCKNILFVKGYLNLRKALYYPASFLIEAIFGLAAWIVAKTRKVDLVKATKMNKKISPKIVLFSFLIAIASLCFFGLLTYAYSDFLSILGYTSKSSGIEIPNFGIYLFYIFLSCAVPAFFEEMLFRGVIVSGLSKKKEIYAIIFGAFIFMIMHGSADQTMHQFIVGLLIGYIFVKTKNLWIGFFVHFFNNFISITITFLYTIFGTEEEVAGALTSANGTIDTVGTVSQASEIFTWVMECLIAIFVAVVGYFVVIYLVNKVIQENERVNGSSETSLTSENLSQTEQTQDVQDMQTSNLNATRDEFYVDPNDYKVSDDDYKVSAETTADNSSLSEGDLTSENVQEGEQNLVTTETSPVESSNGATSNENKNQFNPITKSDLATKLMFAVSIGYLVIDWLLSFLGGF